MIDKTIMEEYKQPEQERPEPKASDSEVAAFFAQHMDNPCEVEVAPGDIRNIREFYLREAKKVLWFNSL